MCHCPDTTESGVNIEATKRGLIEQQQKGSKLVDIETIAERRLKEKQQKGVLLEK